MKTRTVLRKRRPDRLAGLLLCEPIFAPLEEHLRTTGLAQHEEAALITGYVVGGAVGVGTTAMLPYTENTIAACSLPMDVTLACTEMINRCRQVLLAQVHTHPGRICAHSHTDDDWAFSDAPGVFSIVVPCLGRFGLRELLPAGAAVYERLVSGEWRRIPPVEVRRRLFVIPSHRAVL